MLIAIEGIDGAGKGTQANLLAKNLNDMGIMTQLFSFPYYNETFFGKEVGKYLNGQYGQLADVSIEFASLLYAGDRFEKKREITDSLKSGSIVICDRYVPSNLAHQAAKAPDEHQQAKIEWISKLEYEIFGLPKADLIFLLDMPLAKSTELVLKKKKRTYTDERLDLHEASTEYLAKVNLIFQQLAIIEKWEIIHCVDSTGLLSIEDISAQILSAVIKKNPLQQ